MTEYDYSPEAFEAYIHKQQQIARWVDRTNRSPQKNPFTPATPAVQALALDRGLDSDDEYDSDNRRRPRRREHRDRDRQRDWERDRDRDRDRERSAHGHSDSSSRPRPGRHRSASHSAPPRRPDHARAFSGPPPPLPIPPVPSPTNQYPPQYPYPPRLTSPRDSRHSSRTSSTQVPSPTSYTFAQQQVPYSAPPFKSVPGPIRSQTLPNYVYPLDSKYAYPTQYYPNASAVYSSPAKPIDLAVRPSSSPFPFPLDSDLFLPFTRAQNAPQLPYSVYQTKQPPLLKRIFGGFLRSNKQPQPQRRSRHHRTNSF
ncbi:hypothetical protein CVT26_011731 [Gymnopilus dilepis]|uniref:Uncharacterized protein n=1 Tax=Gymnopilus dilepis TaxID=231916 RepID=A0A409W5Z4_9AGAR|nr:hypothetical protein CVT26_011731 [Gymnopilus dilepis]